MKLRFKISTPNILNNAEEAIRKYWKDNPIFLPDTPKEESDKILTMKSIAYEWTKGGKEIEIEIDLIENSARLIHESEKL